MKKIQLAYLLGVIIALWFPNTARAAGAALYITPDRGGAFAIGHTFTIDVSVASTDQAINAVSLLLSYPQDTLQVVSISTQGSIINFWAQGPSFSQQNGTISLDGIVTNPGFQGGAGRIVGISFKVIAPGDATVYFKSASVLANDGLGTNILDRITLGEYTLGSALPPPDLPKAETVEVFIQTLTSPVISEYPESLRAGNMLRIAGTSLPHAFVKVFIQKDEDPEKTTLVRADETGGFSYAYPQPVAPGAYRIAAQATDERGAQSERSDAISIVVSTSLLFTGIASFASLALSISALTWHLRRRGRSE